MRAVALYGTLGSASLLLAAGLATPATAGATSAAGAHPPTPPAQTAAEARGVAAAAQRAAARGITFRRCPGSEQLPAPIKCGKVSVPLDYAHPQGKRVSLTVSRIRATGKASKRQGALVYNPGGPGGSGMQFPLAAEHPELRKAAKVYDFVGYAPRGVGRSAPLSCQDPVSFAKAPTSSPTFPTPAFKQKMIAGARAYAKGCARGAGSALAHYTTLNNARDLDVLRAALGEKRLNFLGASYGTYFGGVYATLFPTHVRRMVFDSVVNPDPAQIWYQSNLTQSLVFELRWADWRAWVAKHNTVYHLGKTSERVLASYDKARRRLDRKPAGGKVGTGQLQDAYLRTGYNDDYWDSSAHALSAYLRGDPGPLVELAAPDPATAADDENANAVYTAVECNDAPWPRDWGTWDRDNTDLAARAPFETWDNAWMNLPCAFWTARQQQPVDIGAGLGTGSLPPVLLLAAERDAATPYEGALELQRRLPGSALVTERRAGTHGLTGGPNACVNGHLTTYLLTGKTPGPAASCAPRAEPEPGAASEAKKPKKPKKPKGL